jgi:hypothetical protein
MAQKIKSVNLAGHAWTIALCACLCAYVLLQVQGPPVITGEGYLERSRLPLLDLSFFISARAFTTTLLYKICGSDPAAIVTVQKILLVAGWSFLSAAFGALIGSSVLRFCSLTIFPLMALWWNLLGWTLLLRSEACSFALFAIWLSTLLYFLKQPSRLRLGILTAMAMLFSFTKDNIPYFLIVVAVLLLVCGRLFASALFRRYAGLFKALLLAMLLLGIAQNISAQAGKRQQFCLVNVLLQRILPDPEYTAWFIKQGMPVDNSILQWKGQWASSEEFKLFKDNRYEPFMDWVLCRGTVTYARFLIEHPAYTFRPLVKNLPELFSYNLTLYAGLPPDKLCLRLLYALLPATSLLFAAALSLFSLRAATAYKRPICILPLILLLSAFCNALFVYHADAMEVPRHALMNMLCLECLSYMALLLLADIIAAEKYPLAAETAVPPGTSEVTT